MTGKDSYPGEVLTPDEYAMYRKNAITINGYRVAHVGVDRVKIEGKYVTTLKKAAKFLKVREEMIP